MPRRLKYPRKTKAELAEIEADLAYWQELATLTGWRVFGFSYRHSCQYLTTKLSRPMAHPLEVLTMPQSEPNAFIDMNAQQRDDLVIAIKSKKGDYSCK